MAETNPLKAKFISHILHEESMEIDQAQRVKMTSSGFTSPELLNDRQFTTTDNQLQYRHLSRHRFIDMNYRNSSAGRAKKISYPVHNKILFGGANNIVRRLSFGYTTETKELLLSGDMPKTI